VSCDFSQSQLYAYFDGELDAIGAAAFENHLQSCRECQSVLASEEALRSALAKAHLYECAPFDLRKAVNAQLRAAPTALRGPIFSGSAWRWLAVAASFVIVATLGWQFFPRFRGFDSQPPIIAAALDAHLRSLQQGHLADVESTDQHTVKPWFDGKLDFAPPVHDFTSDGFPLEGGRLDVLDGKTVAALVYGRRKHIINVFIWKAGADNPARSGTRQGYNWLAWQKGDFAYCAVSDVTAPDLQQLMQLFSRE
jgi:anti-sigma factor (TIGR02949 family)